MKNKKRIMIYTFIIIFFTVLNVIILGNVWYDEYMTFDKITSKDTQVLTNLDRQSYLETYTNFNSAEFSIEELYDNISNGMKKKYDTLEKFRQYYDEKIGNKFDGEQYYSIMEYISEEKKDGYNEVKFRIYFYDLEAYIEMLDNEKVNVDTTKFSVDVFLVEKSIDDYEIEI